MSTELWRKSEHCPFALGYPQRGARHLSRGWASGWLRPSHLLMSWPVSLHLWLYGPTPLGVSAIHVAQVLSPRCVHWFHGYFH